MRQAPRSEDLESGVAFRASRIARGVTGVLFGVRHDAGSRRARPPRETANTALPRTRQRNPVDRFCLEARSCCRVVDSRFRGNDDYPGRKGVGVAFARVVRRGSEHTDSVSRVNGETTKSEYVE